MALPDFSINPYVQPYVGGIQKETSNLIGQRVADYDLAAEGYDVLGYQTDTLKQNIAPFEADSLYAQELMGKYRKEIDRAAEKGDYEFMLRDIKKNARQFAAETSPLIARRQAYDAYRKSIQEQYQKGEIGLNMYNAAMQKTIQDNSNVDKEAVMSGSFSGFIPSKKVDISKMLDDAIKGMESNGRIGKMQVNEDGTYTIVGGEFRNADDILKAADSYLQGSSDYKNYATTMANLGLQDDLINETIYARNAVAEKYKFNKPNAQQGFVPKDAWDRYASQFPAPLDTSIDEVTNNPQTVNKFDNNIVDPKGNLLRDTRFYKANPDGSYSAYYDSEGNQITLDTKEKLDSYNAVRRQGAQGAQSTSDTPKELKYITKTLSKEESKKLKQEQNAEFNTLIDNTLLRDSGFDLSNISESQRKMVLNTPTANAKRNDPNYRKEVLNRYNTALKNHKKTETFKYVKQLPSNVKTVGDIANMGENPGVLERSLSGRNISVLTTNVDELGIDTGFQDGKKDINTLNKLLNDKGWVVNSMQDNGILTFNPADPNGFGASSVTLYLTKGTGENKEQRQINIGVGIDLRDQVPILRTMQQVANAHLSGNGGIVPITGTDKSYKVITVPSYLYDGSSGFNTKVVLIDKEGNEISDRVPFDGFLYEMSPIVAQQANKFLTNKAPK